MNINREFAKTLTFAILHFAVGFSVTFAFTGSLAIAGGVALVEPLANTVVFYFHERSWACLGHGHARSEQRLELTREEGFSSA